MGRAGGGMHRDSIGSVFYLCKVLISLPFLNDVVQVTFPLYWGERGMDLH
jgi:hypothetical protein